MKFSLFPSASGTVKELVEGCRVRRIFHQVCDGQHIKELADAEKDGDDTEDDPGHCGTPERLSFFRDNGEADCADAADDGDGKAKQQSVRIAKIPLIREIVAKEFFSRLGR